MSTLFERLRKAKIRKITFKSHKNLTHDHLTAMMMNDFRFYHKDFLLGFLDVYKNLPSLWQIKHPEYHNKAKKDKDFETLIKKMKEIEPRADRNSVANKISNLRSVYKRECKRLSKFQPNKKPAELVSETVWYFEHLHFLQDHKPRSITLAVAAKETETNTAKERPTKPIPIPAATLAVIPKILADNKSEEPNQEESTQATSKRKAETAANTVDHDRDGVAGEPQAKTAKLQSPNTNEESTVKVEEIEKVQSNESKIEPIQETPIQIPDLILKTEPEEATIETHENDDRDSSDDLLSEVGCSTFNSEHANSDRVERNQNFDLMERNNFDRFDHMTSAWAGILRNLPRSQQIFSEKLINDVLFEAQLEGLSRQSVVLASNSKNKENGTA